MPPPALRPLAAPSLLVVAAQHRYVLPLAPAAELRLAEARVRLLAVPLPRLDAAPPAAPAGPAVLGGAALRLGAGAPFRPPFPATLPLLGVVGLQSPGEPTAIED